MKLPAMLSKCAIFDFDSTLISIETLDFLIGKSAKENKSEVEKITHMAMSGKLTFADSLRLRFADIKLEKSDIDALKNEICNYLTEGFVTGINQLESEFDIYIISGGFLEIIAPVAEKLGISPKNCFANNFIYQDQKVVGFEQANIMAQNGGKPKIVEQILSKKSYDKIFMIGDGYTDLEVSKANSKVTFCGFGEHVVRDSVLKEAENFFYNVADLIKFLRQ